MTLTSSLYRTEWRRRQAADARDAVQAPVRSAVVLMGRRRQAVVVVAQRREAMTGLPGARVRARRRH